MKKIIFLFLSFCIPTIVGAQAPDKKDKLIGYFDGRTPCQEIAKQLNEQTTPECIKIKWRLTLYQNGQDITSGTYSLEGFKFRGANVLKGKWHLTKGTGINQQAVVYQLDLQSRGSLYFLKADDDVLLFLDQTKNIMVGNQNFSYALYRSID